MRVSAHTCAALSAGSAASTRNPMPRPMAAWQLILASWPAPTMPTTGTRWPAAPAGTAAAAASAGDTAVPASPGSVVTRRSLRGARRAARPAWLSGLRPERKYADSGSRLMDKPLLFDGLPLTWVVHLG